MTETLNEKALEAAWNSFLREGGTLENAIRTGDYAGLVTDLTCEDYRHEMQHLRSSAEIDRLFQQAATAIAALVAERDAFKRMCRENYDAFSAMRNDINELIGNMVSQGSTLSSGPEMSYECATVVEAVNSYVHRVDTALAKIEEGAPTGNPNLTSENSWGNYDDVFFDGGTQTHFELASIARRARAVKGGEDG